MSLTKRYLWDEWERLGWPELERDWQEELRQDPDGETFIDERQADARQTQEQES